MTQLVAPVVEDALAAVLMALVGVGLLAGGLFVVRLGIDRLLSFWRNANRRATEVSGTITETRLEENYNARRDPPKFTFVPVVEYEFDYYDGETYTSRNLYPGSETVPPFDDRGPAKGVIGEYEEGDTVTVSVPDDPEAAYLEVPSAGTSIDMVVRYVGVLFLGGVLVAFGVLLFREAYLAIP